MKDELKEKYGLPTAVAMVVGIVIGSGIFFKAEKILLATGGNLQIGILAWVLGALIAVSCACAFAVMAAHFDSASGVIDYATATVGKDYAYYLGWFMSTIYYPCLTGCLAWVSARYTCVLLNYDIVGGECMTITMLYLITIFFINAVAPLLAGKLQISLTIIKLIPILLLAVVGTFVGLSNGLLAENFSVVSADVTVKSPLFTALAATSFAYEGWIIATTISGELKDAKRNMPIALVLGVGSVGLIYLLFYTGMAGAVPNSVLMESGQDGTIIAYVNLFGDAAAILLFVFVVLSCLGTCNGLMMGCARGFYGMAQRGRGPAPKMLAQLDGYTNMPNNAAAAGLLFATLWSVYFYFGTLMQELGPFNFDSSEIPIITLYAFYIPVFLMFMKKGEGESTLKRYVFPGLGILGSAFMVFAGIMSYGVSTLYYLMVFGVVMLIGAAYAKEKSID
ncbi:MAG: APC family permease [Eubacteriales bacterium]